MDHNHRAFRAVCLVALVVALGGVALGNLGTAAPAHAAPPARPAQQGVQASGFITLGTGTCFPDALLMDCAGNVTYQLKGPGGSGYFTQYLNQWVDLDGADMTCVVGDHYIQVVNIAAKPSACGTPATASPPPGSTATPVPPTATAMPPVGTPTPTPVVAGNLALGKAVFVSSAPDPAHPGEAAVDGLPDTYWASIPDPQPVWDVRHVQWIYVDLGAEYEVKDMRMLWVDGRHPRVYGVNIWRESWHAWQWLARTDYGKPDDAVSFPVAVKGRYFMLWLEVPSSAGSQYELREWQIGGDAGAPIQSTNIAAGRASIALSLEPGFDAGKATDADLNTEWRSSTGLPQWLYVDLTTAYDIDKAILRWVTGMHATSYSLYAWSGAQWLPIYSTTRGTGVDETVTFRSINTRYLLVYATAGPAANVGLRELEVYQTRGSGSPLPRPLSEPAGWRFGSAAAEPGGWSSSAPAGASRATGPLPVWPGLSLVRSGELEMPVPVR